jgi:hypothetical protein
MECGDVGTDSKGFVTEVFLGRTKYKRREAQRKSRINGRESC